MKSKVLLFIGAVVIVGVAAINVNVSLKKEKKFNVSLENVRALANTECSQSGTSLLALSSYKMTVANTGKYGGIAIRNNPSIATAPYNAYGLDVEQQVLANTSTRTNAAIKAYAVAPEPLTSGYSKAIGVQGIAGNAQSGYNYGVYAGLNGCNNGTALFATTETTYNQLVNGCFAGYFQGRVYISERLGIGQLNPSYTLDVNGSVRCTTITTTSDSRNKTNVKDLRSTVNKIAKLRPVTYNFKPEDLSAYYALVPDTVKIEDENRLREYFGLGEGIMDVKKQHIGFIAQELKEVFPELVYEDSEGMLSIDYVSLIPVLTGAVQEQQKIIQEQDETIRQMSEVFQMLSNRLDALERNTNNAVQENNFSFSLYPNPTSDGFVTVNYTMLVDAPIGMELYNMYGQKQKVLVPVQNQHAGSYSVQASVAGLNTGAYIVRATSGNQSESKQLVIK